ncbi:MAG: peptidyl-prolyl cis-trans isomerase [Hyphomicrobiaceae bacterium]
MRFVKRILQEPLVHFLVAGCILFALFSLTGEADSVAKDRIIVSSRKVAQIVSTFEATWRRKPTDQELWRLIDDYVREEIYVREALALGLDQNDTVIRRRLRQKMEFMSASFASEIEPDEATLRAYFQKNSEKYKTESAVEFEHIFLGAQATAEEISRVRSALDDGQDPRVLSKQTLIPPGLKMSVKTSVDGVFGTGFFDALIQLPLNEWQGPIQSGYGLHFVRLTARRVPLVPRFEEVRKRVLEDWRRSNIARIKKDNFDRMSARYEIDRPERKAQ